LTSAQLGEERDESLGGLLNVERVHGHFVHEQDGVAGVV
jgi:hypothetical protein